jgi:pimeloyl-ACP methyl ester carboxylesterase
MNGVWSVADLAGKPADVYEPPETARPRFGVLYLHDWTSESLRERPAFTRLFDELRLACVCPQGQCCWWADRRCTEFDAQRTPERHLLDDVLPSFAARWGLPSRSVGLLGIGMGGQGALRLAFKHPQRFPVAVALAAALDYHEIYGMGTTLDDLYDSKEQCRQDTAPMHLHPSHYPPHLFFCIDPDDPWARGCERLHEKLGALGVPHEADLTTRAGGHSWQYFNHQAERAVRFLHAGLELESRRLL